MNLLLMILMRLVKQFENFNSLFYFENDCVKRNEFNV